MTETSSRIFVRGLPSNMKVDDFKIHFSKSSPITDAKLIPHRRIGYLGYESPEAAAKAVNYYNKTFIRMSKILVELAKPIATPHAEHAQKLEEQNITSKNNPGNRREEEIPQSSQLLEYLQVMQPPSKSKIWSNEEKQAAETRNPVSDAALGVDDLQASDSEYEPTPKRRRKSFETENRQLDGQSPIAIAQTFAEETTDEVQEAKGNIGRMELPAVPASDADWLRSRTSRLLGFQEDEAMDDSFQNIAVDTETVGVNQQTTLSPLAHEIDGHGESNAHSPDPLAQKGPEGVDGVQSPDSGRLFIRNMSYQASTEDLRELFASHGTIEEVHISTDARTGLSKGFAYIQFAEVDAASRALKDLDGSSFRGRLLHILPAAPKKGNSLDEYAISKLPHKKQQQIKRKAEAASAAFRWNSLYMSADAIMSSISDRLGVSKSEVLDPTSSKAAIKQAHAEISIIQETKAYLASHGVNIDSFKKHEFSDTTILVKNFAYGTTSEEIRQLFETHGTVKKIIIPPSGTIAIVELENFGQARAAFAALAYRRCKESVLFLEKAPKTIFNSNALPGAGSDNLAKEGSLSVTDLIGDVADNPLSSTLFVKNLSFNTTSAQLHDLFLPLQGFLSAKVKTKTDPKRPEQVLSMGFGFIEFRSREDAQAALKALNGHRLDGHEIIIKASHKALNMAEQRRMEDMAKKVAQKRTKIIIKNLPFETTKKDVRELFVPYGKLRSVRVPKKFDSSTRGFAFADFVTAKEAQNAMNALMGAHLLGRRLNLEFAAEDAIDPEEEIEKMSRKVGKQADKVAFQRLSNGGRKRFSVNNIDEDDI